MGRCSFLKLIQTFCAIFVLTLSFNVQNSTGTYQDQVLSGPHVCHHGGGQTCCPGWALSPAVGMCLQPVCSYGCQSGHCVGPNTCRCPGNVMSVSCHYPYPYITDVPEGNTGLPRQICEQMGCHQTCHMIKGQPQCTCMAGFFLTIEDNMCEDINECQRYPSICQQECQNTLGSFMCTCYPGHRLAENGRTCRKLSDYSDSPCGTGHMTCKSSQFQASSSQTGGYQREVLSRLFPRKQLPFRSKGRDDILQERTRQNDFTKGLPYPPIDGHLESPQGSPPYFANGLKAERPSCLPGYECHSLPGSGQQRHLDDSLQTRGEIFDGTSASIPVRSGNFLQKFKYDSTAQDKSYQRYSSQSRHFFRNYPVDARRSFSAKLPDSKLFLPETDVKQDIRGYQSDIAQPGEHPLCRGDLCNDPIRARELRATLPPPTLSTKAFVMTCPDGYRKVLREDLEFCEPLANVEIKDSRPRSGETLTCPEGQRAVQTSDGERCEQTTKEEDCPKGHITVIHGETTSCIDMSKPPPCPEGQIIQFTGTGSEFICVDDPSVKPTCPKNHIVTPTDNGHRCVPVLDCPPGQIMDDSKTGLSCVPLSTESPCPEGLTKVDTPVGRVCQYDPPRGTTLPTCPPGHEIVHIEGSYRCVPTPTATTTAPITCPPGQVVNYTDKGPFCMLRTKHFKSKCPAGQIEVKTEHGIECRKINDVIPEVNPCPVGAELVITPLGAECRYVKLPVIKPILSVCISGEILTQSLSGFTCQPDMTYTSNFPDCGPVHDFARTNDGYRCVRKEDTTLVCSGGTVLIQKKNGFECSAKMHPTDSPCNKDEVLITDGDISVCRDLKSNKRFCGPDHLPAKTANGYVCRLSRVNIECPRGFMMVGVDTDPRCVSLTAPPCLFDITTPECLAYPDTRSPCAEGYVVLLQKDGFHSCVLEADLPPCGNSICTDTADCDGSEDGNERPCDLKIETLIGDCIPQCSNGGTCINGTCVCSPGVFGQACQSDVDECQSLPVDFCQHRCENTFGSFQCACPTGYTLHTDDKTCRKIDCIPGCTNGGSCVNGVCVCPVGLTGDHCQEDIDECAVSGDKLCEHVCRNTFGGYSCICPPNSRLRQDGRTCMNTTCIPECRNGGRCEEYRCRCPRGYKGIICQFDVNECYPENPCSHTCKNIPGSYRCSCPNGFRLRADRRTCRELY